MTMPNIVAKRRTARRPARASAFTLIELLTVVFIISLLIGILIPSINAARTATKKAATANILRAIDAALEMFKNDNERDFRQTNGYPPSFAHPPIPGWDFNPHLGQFPFLDEESGATPPVVYGAHWLPAMLMGADGLGYVKRSSVPSSPPDLRRKPWCWYPNPDLDERTCDNDRPQGQSPYLDPGGVRTIKTMELPGRPSQSGGELFPGWSTNADNRGMEALPVLVDKFDQPILYYAVNVHGRETNMTAEDRDKDNSYNAGEQQDGPPFYFHQDNEGFTGFGTGLDAEAGWEFGGTSVKATVRLHPLSESGEDYTSTMIKDNPTCFAAYILDRQIQRGLAASESSTTTKKLRPVNANSYLLITAGPDGRYGTRDDVTNLPEKLE